MSKIKRITVSNLKAVAKLTADFNGATAIITGGNNKGKTSFLRSLIDRMRSIKPDRILKQGEKDGFYEMELTTGEKFKWSFDATKEKMVFVTEKNIPTSLTKEICAFYFPKVFDVDRFLEDAPGKQKATLEKLAGIDFSDINRLIAEAEETRTYQNKKALEEKARLGTFDPKMRKEPHPELDEKQAELNAAGIHNERMKGFVFKLDSFKTLLAAGKTSIEEHKQKIKELEDSNMDLENKIDIGEAELKKPERKIKDAIYISNLENEIAVLKSKNKEIEENNIERAKETLYQKTLLNQQAANEEVDKLRNEKLDAIKNAANLPEGFGFSDTGITYEGFEFTREQLSNSRIYIAALKLASVGLGEVKTLHFDASALDKKSLTEIEKWAKAQGLQLLIERPDYEGGEIEYELVEDTK